MNRVLIFLFGMLMLASLAAQAQHQLSGRVVTGENADPVAYANVLLLGAGQGTIANEKGYFRIDYTGEPDSLRISFIGYKMLWLRVTGSMDRLELRLEEQVQLLNEVLVRADAEDYLYPLVAACRKQAGSQPLEARAYYELKSYIKEQQVELVEGFYNLGIRGPDATELSLKAGRIALQDYRNRLFVNLESSRAISSMATFKSNPYFPTSPLELSARQLKKRYYLTATRKYLSDEGDSVLVIAFTPKGDKRQYFAGQLWLLPQSQQLLKLELRCADAAIYPFLPLRPDDQISGVDLHISRQFSPHPAGSHLQHVDFASSIRYRSREQQEIEVQTTAVLHAYAFGDPFSLPRFSQPQGSLSDYHRISAYPYNPPFWQQSEELRMRDEGGKNEAFFRHPFSLTNVDLSGNAPVRNALLSEPYVFWDGARVIFRQLKERPPVPEYLNREVRVDDYNLVVHLYFDVNRLGDSVFWQTATIFDPHQSYFYLPMTNAARCFINMYFDLVERQRRELEQLLKQTEQQPAALYATYHAFMSTAQQERETFFRDLMLGNNEKGVLSWNERLSRVLKIDNVAIYKPFDGG